MSSLHSTEVTGWSRRAALTAALAALGIPFPRHALAAVGEVRVVVGDASEATRQIVAAITRRIGQVEPGTDVRTLAQRPGTATYVAAGPRAFQTALEADLGVSPLIAVFISQETYGRLLAAAPRRPRGGVTAIYAEAAPIHQMALIRAIYARRVAVAVLLGDDTQGQEALIVRAARTHDLDVEFGRVEAGSSAVRVLASMPPAAALLAVPDRVVYTQENLRSLLESTYRRGIGVVGFSVSVVNAGALATAHSTIEDTVAQLAEVLAAISGSRLPAAQYPTYWRVSVNDTVARSLNVVISGQVRALGNPAPS